MMAESHNRTNRFLFDETNTDVGDFYKKLSEKIVLRR